MPVWHVVLHVLCAADRPCPESGNDAKGFLFWHAPELYSLVWPHPILTVPKLVCSWEQMTAQILHALLAKGVVPCQPMLSLSGSEVSLLCQNYGRNDWKQSQGAT